MPEIVAARGFGSGTFSITTSPSPWQVVVSPEAGSELEINSLVVIQWSSFGTSGQVDIDVSRDLGTTWEIIADDTPDDGASAWTVTGPPSSTCLIRIVHVDGLPAGISGQFHIAERGSIALVDIPGGTFQMGYEDPSGAGFDQAPVHTVRVRDFRMSKYEMTLSQYAQFDPTHQSQFSGHRNRPVESVRWFDAARFCDWLSAQVGLTLFHDAADLASGVVNVRMDWTATGYRLATEAEWEYACRAGTAPHYYGGHTDTLYNHCTPLDPTLDPIAWYCGTATAAHDVGQKVPNAFDL